MFDFIRYKSIPLVVSGAVFIASIIVLAVFGLKPGIDFTGGSLLEVSFSSARPKIEEVERALSPLGFGAIVIQPTGGAGMILKLRHVSESEHARLLSALRDAFPAAPVIPAVIDGESEPGGPKKIALEIPSLAPPGELGVAEQRFETIGPSISDTLRSHSWRLGLAVIVSIIAFIAYAFRKVSRPVASWRYGVVAVLALIHTVVITTGVFALLGKFRGVEVDITFLVALLTVFGYSVNDTIVIFDRVRENLLRDRRGAFREVVNRGINETYGRSITNSITVLLVLTAMFLFGGPTIHYFCLTLIIGIVIGTYASIFVATGLLVSWHERLEKQKAVGPV